MKRNWFKKITTIAFIATILLAATAKTAYAGTSEVTKDHSGNVFGSGDSVSWNENVDNELFLTGFNVSALNVDVDGSAFAAGYDVAIKENKVGSSVFAAGYNVTIDSDVNNNIFVAGLNLILNENTSAKSLYAAGSSLNIKGDFDYANISGSNVYFDANVDGDVSIDADTITFGDNAHIGGNLDIKSNEEPETANIAKGTVTFEQKNSNEEETIEAVEEIGKATVYLSIVKRVKKFIYWTFAFALLAVVFKLLFSKHLDDSVAMVNNKTAPMLLSGFLGMIVVPFFILIAAVTIIGLPVAGLTGILLIIIRCTSRVFAFASFGRNLIFGKMKKRLNPMLETVLAVLPAAFIKVIPFVGWLVGIACFIYSLGYVLQVGYSILGSKKKSDTVTE